MSDDEADRLWAVTVAAGHLDCGGWSYDAHTRRLVCACSARLYKSALAVTV